MLKKFYNYKLCYISSSQYLGELMILYFTKENLKNQWGDDWNDVPYEHNSEPPSESYEDQIISIILRDPIYPRFLTPRSNVDNSNYSVEHINNKIVPWLTIKYDDHSTFIQAGTTLKSFLEILKEIDADFEVSITYKIKNILKTKEVGK